MPIPSTNTSGFRGVYPARRNDKVQVFQLKIPKKGDRKESGIPGGTASIEHDDPHHVCCMLHATPCPLHATRYTHNATFLCPSCSCAQLPT